MTVQLAEDAQRILRIKVRMEDAARRVEEALAQDVPIDPETEAELLGSATELATVLGDPQPDQLAGYAVKTAALERWARR